MKSNVRCYSDTVKMEKKVVFLWIGESFRYWYIKCVDYNLRHVSQLNMWRNCSCDTITLDCWFRFDTWHFQLQSLFQWPVYKYFFLHKLFLIPMFRRTHKIFLFLWNIIYTLKINSFIAKNKLFIGLFRLIKE